MGWLGLRIGMVRGSLMVIFTAWISILEFQYEIDYICQVL